MGRVSRLCPLCRGIALASLFAVGVFATAMEARGVILYSTADRNTTAPSAADGLDAWNLEATWGSFLATPIDATHFIGAKHLNAASDPGQFSTITFRNVSYAVNLASAVPDPGSDLCIYSLQSGYSFPSYAPLYNAAVDGSEIGKTLTVIGRGTQRGTPVTVDSALKGWAWGGSDHVESWGQNIVSSFDRYNSVSATSLLCFDFNSDGIDNEAALSIGDSSGGVFIFSNGQWKLAGINYAVSGPFSLTGTGTLNSLLPDGSPDPDYSAFNASIYDAQGLYYWDDKWILDDVQEPGTSAASRISDRLDWIESVVPEPGTLVLLSIFIAAIVPFSWFARRRKSA